MHELSVCQAMLRQIQEIAASESASAVNTVVVRIGPLSGVEPELLRQAFPIATAGSVADGAELQVEELPIRVRCLQCGAETEARINRLVCGSCADYRTRVLSGDEMLLASVELTRDTSTHIH